MPPLLRQVSRGEVDKLLDRVDINNDGHVEFGELASALVDWRQVWYRVFWVFELKTLLLDWRAAWAGAAWQKQRARFARQRDCL